MAKVRRVYSKMTKPLAKYVILSPSRVFLWKIAAIAGWVLVALLIAL